MSKGLENILNKIREDPSRSILHTRYLALVGEIIDKDKRDHHLLDLGKVYFGFSPQKSLEVAQIILTENKSSLPALKLIKASLIQLGRNSKAALIEEQIQRVLGASAATVTSPLPPLPDASSAQKVPIRSDKKRVDQFKPSDYEAATVVDTLESVGLKTENPSLDETHQPDLLPDHQIETKELKKSRFKINENGIKGKQAAKEISSSNRPDQARFNLASESQPLQAEQTGLDYWEHTNDEIFDLNKEPTIPESKDAIAPLKFKNNTLDSSSFPTNLPVLNETQQIEEDKQPPVETHSKKEGSSFDQTIDKRLGQQNPLRSRADIWDAIENTLATTKLDLNLAKQNSKITNEFAQVELPQTIKKSFERWFLKARPHETSSGRTLVWEFIQNFWSDMPNKDIAIFLGQTGLKFEHKGYWGLYLDGLLTAGAYRKTIQEIRTRLLNDEFHSWANAGLPRLNRALMATGQKPLEWKSTDGIESLREFLLAPPKINPFHFIS